VSKLKILFKLKIQEVANVEPTVLLRLARTAEILIKISILLGQSVGTFYITNYLRCQEFRGDKVLKYFLMKMLLIRLDKNFFNSYLYL